MPGLVHPREVKSRRVHAQTRCDANTLGATQVSELATPRRSGADLQLAHRDHAYEPDPPIRTPRIFATASADGTGVVVGSARAVPGAEDLVQHPSLFLEELPPARVGLFVIPLDAAGFADDAVVR